MLRQHIMRYWWIASILGVSACIYVFIAMPVTLDNQRIKENGIELAHQVVASGDWIVVDRDIARNSIGAPILEEIWLYSPSKGVWTQLTFSSDHERFPLVRSLVRGDELRFTFSERPLQGLEGRESHLNPKVEKKTAIPIP